MSGELFGTGIRLSPTLSKHEITTAPIRMSILALNVAIKADFGFPYKVYHSDSIKINDGCHQLHQEAHDGMKISLVGNRDH